MKYIISSFYLGKSFLINRHGAAEARGAHNSEDVGSKPTAGTLVMMRITT
jgi:hypothetical protein